jgi:hypothetical protein
MLGGVVYMPLLVRGKLPVLVGARQQHANMPLHQQAHIVLLRVVVLQLVVVMLRLLLVVIGSRMLMFLIVDSGLLLVGLLELSMAVLLVLCQLRVVVRGQLFLLLMVGGRVQ